MTDFTKYELEDMHVVYRTFCNAVELRDRRDLTELESSILNKIESMIDTYCEHEWEYGCRASYQCVKCMELKKDE